MATVIDALFITLGLDPKGMEKGMKEAEGYVRTGVNKLTNLLAPLAGAFAASKLFGDYTGNVRVLRELSERTGESVEQLSAWGRVAEDAGGNADTFAASLLNLRNKMIENPGLFRAYGLSATSSTQALKGLASLSQRMDSRQFERLASSMGIDFKTMQLLRNGPQALSAALAAQSGGYTGVDARAVESFDRQWRELGRTVEQVSAPIIKTLIPAFNFLLEKVRQLTEFIGTHKEFVIGALAGIATVITIKVIPALLKMAAAWLANPLIWIIGGIVLLAAVLEDLYVYINGGESAFEGFWKKLGTGSEVAEKLKSAWLSFKQVMATLAPYITTVVNTILTFAAFKGVIGTVETGIKVFKFFSTEVKYLAGAFKLLGRAFMANPLGFIITLLVAGALLIIENWETVKKLFFEFFEWLGGKWKEFKEWVLPSAEEGAARGNETYLNDAAGVGGGAIPLKYLSSAYLSYAQQAADAANMAASSVVTETNITGPITINTAATDAMGIAGALNTALVNQIKPGVNQ